MRDNEPPSPTGSALLQVGKDRYGHWIVRDPQGLRGGIFIDRGEALKYAMFETGNRPQAVIMVPGTLELTISSNTPRIARAAKTNTANRLARVA